MIEQEDKELFWAVVKECLQEFYGMDQSEAAKHSDKLRKMIEMTTTRRSNDLFYHAEPIDVASDLANNRRDLSKKEWRKYDEILARHEW